MNGVGFEILARTPLPHLLQVTAPAAPPPAPPPDPRAAVSACTEKKVRFRLT